MSPASPSPATPEPSRGATPSQLTRQMRFASWWTHHQRSAVLSLRQMVASPGQSLTMWLVIAIALALPSGLLLAVGSVRTISDQWQIRPGITLYLKGGLSEAAISSLGQRLQQFPGISSVEYISPQQGLEELKRSGGFGEALLLLEQNPLPPVYILRTVDGGHATLSTLRDQAAALPEVLRVELDMEWVQRLQQILRLLERCVLLLGFLLGLGVLLTVGNITRLLIERRREEIALVKLVGGTDAFVRRPLLYSGLWYGLVGGVLAWLLLWGAGLYLSPVWEAFLDGYGVADAPGRGLGPGNLLQLSLVGATLGVLGAWLAAGRHLRSVEPS